MPTTPDLAEVIRRALEARLSELHVAMPGVVTAYNASRETVDVRPGFRRVLEAETDDGDLQFEDLPIIPDVPIAWPSGAGGSCFVTFPLAAGDPVLLVFCERDPSAWRETGQPTTPGDLRAHHLSGAVAIPGGIRPNAGKLGSGKVSGTKIVIGSEVFVGSASASEPMVKGNAFKTYNDAHAHGTPFGPTSTPLVPLPPNVLSTKHKLDG